MRDACSKASEDRTSDSELFDLLLHTVDVFEDNLCMRKTDQSKALE